MEYDPTLAVLLAQPWSNNVCRGYVIYAMENFRVSPPTQNAKEVLP